MAPAPPAPDLRRLLERFPQPNHYLVGVSGGRDSVALLHLLREHHYDRLTVCHLNHGLRNAADADALFVKELADRMDLAVVIGRADVAALARKSKQSLETAARAARYRFFGNVSRQRRCRTLFLGHHADDQVETFLFNLFRGAGPAGLAGMTMESEREEDGLRILRPLLGVWRSELDAYLSERGISYREDATNEDPAHTRNRLRASIIPEIERIFGRQIKTAVWRAADILAAEDEWMRVLVEEATHPMPDTLPVAALGRIPLAVQRRVLRAWLEERGISGIGYETVEAVRSLIDTWPDGPAKVNLPGDRHARRRNKELFITDPVQGNAIGRPSSGMRKQATGSRAK